MKKIFAIALALVMVLSMASAFAWCDVIDWSTTTNCGKGSVEVVPYAKGNKVGGNTWTATECAGAVNGEYAYFAIKVTVDANPNQDWWAKAKLTVSGTGFAGQMQKMNASMQLVDWHAFDTQISNLATAGTYEAGTYYLNYNGTLSTSFDPAKTLFGAWVNDAASAKVCAELKSVSDAKGGAVDVNGSSVLVFDNGNKYGILVDGVYFNFEDGGKFLDATVGTKVYDRYINDVFICAGATGVGTATAEATCYGTDDYKAIKDAMAAINITWGQKISQATAYAKLSKTDKVSDCATWNSEVLAVVNPDCFVMEIPKTGDKGLLWWLF